MDDKQIEDTRGSAIDRAKAAAAAAENALIDGQPEAATAHAAISTAWATIALHEKA